MVEWIVWLNEIPTPTECEGKREREKKGRKNCFVVKEWKSGNNKRENKRKKKKKKINKN